MFNILPVLFVMGDIGNKIKDIIEARNHLKNLVHIIEYTNTVGHDDKIPYYNLDDLKITLNNVSFQ